MARTGSAATDWITCDIVLLNADQLWKSQNGMMNESDVCRLETTAELDTGSSELGLPPYHIQKLELVTLGSPIEIESALDGKKTKVTVFGPVTIDFCGKQISVPVYELKHTPRALLGLEPGQRLKIDIDWIHSKVILPSTTYPHKAYFIAPRDLLNLFGLDGHTIEALQEQHKVSIEINNRKKVSKVVMIICTKENINNVREAEATIQAICPSLTPAPEEERP
jgi:predicted aspartyl protease